MIVVLQRLMALCCVLLSGVAFGDSAVLMGILLIVCGALLWSMELSDDNYP